MSIFDILKIKQIKRDLKQSREAYVRVKTAGNRLKGEYDRLRADSSKLMTAYNLLKDADTQLKLEYYRAQADLAELKTTYSRLETADSQLKLHFETIKSERDDLKIQMSQVERLEAYGLIRAITALKEQQKSLQDKITLLGQETQSLEVTIELKRQDVIELDDEALLQSFGLYKPRYDFETSEHYRRHLEEIRSGQKQMIKAGTAASSSTSWTVNNSEKEGGRMIKDYVKLILRAFNNECDASITNIKFNNIKSIEQKILKAFETLNKLGERMSISINHAYLELKLKELYLCYEYQVKKQEEREIQRQIREQMREEAKVALEIEEARQKLEKEQQHFAKAQLKINQQLQMAQTDAERAILEAERENIHQKQVQIEENIKSVEIREQNTRAGYVYIISNIGSFGENIYKIGMTRRLEPQERVDELGDASVPFTFDVHALIFSEDAPKLENALHRTFDHRRLNLINRRREFFQVSLDEIEEVVRTNFSKPVEMIHVAEATHYRESLLLRHQRQLQAAYSISQ